MWEVNSVLQASVFLLLIFPSLCFLFRSSSCWRRQVRLMLAFLARAVVICAHLSLALMFTMNTVSGFHQLSGTLLSLSGLASLLKTHYFQLCTIYLLVRAYNFHT